MYLGCVCGCVCCTQSCLTLCDPVAYSPPDSSSHRILQARMLEWVAISYSRGSSQPRNRTCLSCICFIGRQILYHWQHPYVFYPCFHIGNECTGGNGEGEETSLGAHLVPSTQGLGSLPKPSNLGQWGKGMGLTSSLRKFSYLTMA